MTKMKTYTVGVCYDEYSEFEVEASNKKEAMEEAKYQLKQDGDGGVIDHITELKESRH